MNETTTYELLIAAFEGEGDGVDAIARLTAAFRGNPAAMPAAASIVKDAAGALIPLVKAGRRAEGAEPFLAPPPGACYSRQATHP